MKNIHVLSTDKPSRLQLQMNGKYHLENGQTISLKSYQNIYITSDEEIKEGDYIFETDSGYVNIAGKNYYKNSTDFKIILTTDQYLIKDGVQAIDDEFLEWFVQNPSCEEVEVFRDSREVGGHNGGVQIEYGYYEITIPKEEVLLQSSIDGEPIWGEKPKQETLEEASSRLLYSKYPFHPPQDSGYWKDMFLEGAKWQQEQDKNKYSEEEVEDLIYKVCGTVARLQGITLNGNHIDTAYKKFKKK
jgi:hypothetical protein